MALLRALRDLFVDYLAGRAFESLLAAVVSSGVVSYVVGYFARLDAEPKVLLGVSTFTLAYAIVRLVVHKNWLKPLPGLNADQKQAVADKLSELDSDATHDILNGDYANPTALERADSRWQAKALRVLREASATAQTVKHFSELGDVPAVIYPEKPSWAQKTLRELSLRRKRLADIIGWYQTRKP